MIKIIAVVGKNLELGKNGDLIWHLPNDLKFFKAQTLGHPVAMGKNTFNSLPKMLPGREHYVITDDDDFNKPTDAVDIFYDFNLFVTKCKEVAANEDIYIIGGASIYKQFIDIADELILTEVEAADSTADVYFPEFDKSKYKKQIIGCNSDEKLVYAHVVYTKI